MAATPAAQAAAQPAPAPAPASSDPAVVPPPVEKAAGNKRVYVPADFARFAPRNALDMLNNVPGFSIDGGDTERRGLGQATGNVLINGQRYSGKSTNVLTELQRISAANYPGSGWDEPLRAGMFLSNEPGYYKAGEYGIRIENLVMVSPVGN